MFYVSYLVTSLRHYKDTTIFRSTQVFILFFCVEFRFLIDFVEVACAYGLDGGGCECDFYFVAGVAA